MGRGGGWDWDRGTGRCQPAGGVAAAARSSRRSRSEEESECGDRVRRRSGKRRRGEPEHLAKGRSYTVRTRQVWGGEARAAGGGRPRGWSSRGGRRWGGGGGGGYTAFNLGRTWK
ncbi:hypothetical protein CRUP_012635 [Coryphaenoides rupestris]|nr:hypothetical protein CRUP_012635 [Coryphaenoides rupestris]